MNYNDYKILLSPPHFTGEEQQYLEKAFSENKVAAHGSNIVDFEKNLCDYLSIESSAALVSGTAAIHLALILLGVKENDEVICSSFTFSATANPIVYVQATPIFVDSDRETWNMCPLALEEAIRDRIEKGKKPKAIILVHLYGMPAKINEIMAIATKYQIPVIEDAAEALGSSYYGKALGTFGEIGIFSFNGNKIITTSGGGALVSKNAEYTSKAIFLATQARDKAPHYQHSEIGFNYRMNNVAAGIGVGQLETIADRVQSRRANHDFYLSQLSGESAIHFLDEPANFHSNRWLTTVLTDSFATREAIRTTLEEERIECKPLWKPLHLQPIFQEYPSYLNGNSENFFNKGLCLPSGSNLSRTELEEVVKTILKAL